MTDFGRQYPQSWIGDLFALQEKHQSFLAKRNEKGNFVHSRLRSAFRSLRTNLPLLFLYTEIPCAMIPNTTNHLEGAFSHLKEKLLYHRWLR